MNFATKIKVYVGALAVLTLTALLGIFFNTQANFERQSQEALLTGFETTQAASLALDNGASLVQSSTGWDVLKGTQKFPGNPDKIATFLKDLKALTRQQAVYSGDDLTAYGLASGFKRLVISSKDGKELYNLLIGKASTDEKGVYVKFDKDKTVYLTDRNFSRSLELDFNSWTDLRLFTTAVKPEQIVKLEFKGSLTINNKVVQPYSLVRTVVANQPAWTLAGQTAPIPEGDGLASAIAGRQFTAYMLDSEAFDPAAATTELIITTDRGAVTTLKIGPRDAQNRYPLSDGTRRFWLAEWSLDQLLYKSPTAPSAPVVTPKK